MDSGATVKGSNMVWFKKLSIPLNGFPLLDDDYRRGLLLSIPLNGFINLYPIAETSTAKLIFQFH